MSLIDAQGRQFKSLRLSLTAACNFTCGYCVPEGTTLRPSPNALDGQSLIRLVRLLDRVLGLEKIRLTGGEPLIAPNLKAVLEGLGDINIPTVSRPMDNFWPSTLRHCMTQGSTRLMLAWMPWTLPHLMRWPGEVMWIPYWPALRPACTGSTHQNEYGANALKEH